MQTRRQAQLLKDLIEERISLVITISTRNHMSQEKTKELRLKLEAITTKISEMLS